MKFLIAQQPPSTPQVSPANYPLVEGALIGGAVVWVITIAAPRLLEFWVGKAKQENEADLNRETQFQNAIITALTRSQDAILLQQGTLLSNVLQGNQQTQEEISEVLQIQTRSLQELKDSQSKLHERLQEILEQLNQTLS